MSKRPIIIDVDPGNDDAQAIMLLAGSGLFDIRGICAVHGNVGLEHTAPNALYLAGLTGVDCPVCIGADKAILARKTRAEYAHGGNGLGGLEYTVDTAKFTSIRPWDLMWEEALKCEGELEIFAVGPLTNVALAVLKYPELPKHVKSLTIMGGAATCGNMTAYAEFNIWQDPHALQILLNAGFKEFVMVDLDCCRTAYLNEQEGEAFGSLSAENPWKPFFEQMLSFRKNNPMRANMPVRYGGCDACTAFVLAKPEHAVLEDYFVVCECRSTLSDGQTVVDWTGRFGEKPNVRLARSVDRDAYAKWYLECLHSFEGGNGNE